MWQPMQMMSTVMPVTPTALRKLVINGLPLHPLAQEAKLFLSEAKGYAFEPDVSHVLKGINNSVIYALAILPDGRGSCWDFWLQGSLMRNDEIEISGINGKNKYEELPLSG